jgi:hypothetical protein
VGPVTFSDCMSVRMCDHQGDDVLICRWADKLRNEDLYLFGFRVVSILNPKP